MSLACDLPRPFFWPKSWSWGSPDDDNSLDGGLSYQGASSSGPGKSPPPPQKGIQRSAWGDSLCFNSEEDPSQEVPIRQDSAAVAYIKQEPTQQPAKTSGPDLQKQQPDTQTGPKIVGEPATDLATVKATIEQMKAECVKQVGHALAGTGGFQTVELASSGPAVQVRVLPKYSEGKFDLVVLTGIIEGMQPEDIIALWTTSDVKTWKLVDAGCTAVKKVEEWAELDVKVSQSKQGKYLGGIVSARDYISLQTHWRDKEAFWCGSCEVEHHAMPPASGSMVRARSILSCIRAQEVAEGTALSFMNCIDLKMPTRLYASSLPVEYRKFYRQLGKLARKSWKAPAKTRKAIVEQDIQEQCIDDEAKMADEKAELCQLIHLSDEALQDHLEAIFNKYDDDGNGKLDEVEFARCIAEVGRSLSLSSETLFQLFTAVDSNGDKGVDWQEFVGPAVHIIYSNIKTGGKIEESQVETLL